MAESVSLAASRPISSEQAVLNSIQTTTINKELFKDVQGDILAGGLPKKREIFYFFTILPDQAKKFCVNLGNATGDGMLTFSNVQKMLDERRKIQTVAGAGGKRDLVPSVGANIAFSFRGLKKVWILQGYTHDMTLTDLARCLQYLPRIYSLAAFHPPPMGISSVE